jgi:hypothetical protein
MLFHPNGLNGSGSCPIKPVQNSYGKKARAIPGIKGGKKA